MVVTDPIADMLIRIKNATLSGKENVLIPLSKMKLEIAKVLAEEGYISDFSVLKEKNFPQISIRLKFEDKTPIISEIKRVSKPGRRVYTKKEDIPRVLQGRGIVILSTSKGIITGDEARKKGLGGEILCKIW